MGMNVEKIRKLRVLPVLVLLCTCALCSCHERKVTKSAVNRTLDMMDERLGGIPDDFPEDVPVYPGLRGITVIDSPDGLTLHAFTDDTAEDIVSFYDAALVKAGWNQEGDKNESDEAVSLYYLRDGQKLYLEVGMSPLEKVSMLLTVTEEEPSPHESSASALPDSAEAQTVID